jgi:hypothetical protein
VLDREYRRCNLSSVSLSHTKSSEYLSGYLSLSHTRPVESTVFALTLTLTGVTLKAFTCHKLRKTPLCIGDSSIKGALVSNTGSFILRTYCSKCNLWQFIAMSFPAISREGEPYLLSTPIVPYATVRKKISYSERYVPSGLAQSVQGFATGL